MIRRCAWMFFGVALLAGPAALAQTGPAVSATWAGQAQIVFDARTSGCEKMDIPDANARAFRDAQGNVHLFATHYIARAMVGPTLDAVKQDCRVVYKADEDADPARFMDYNWLAGFHTEDGRRVVALVHSEYHGFDHPGQCLSSVTEPRQRQNCWWNTITMATSEDGGFSFTSPQPPANLVAALPYRFDKANTSGAAGYEVPTNIIKVGGFYYAMISDWPHRAQKYGACLIRTASIEDAKSWRAWDGTGFNTRFVNPYAETDVTPEEHVCAPVAGGRLAEPGSLSVYGTTTPTYVAVQFTPDRRFGPPGLYVSASPDLITWSKPVLVASTESIQADEGPGQWKYGYFALLDPKSTDRNFANITDAPYVYYMRTDVAAGNLARTLMRRPLRLTVTQ